MKNIRINLRMLGNVWKHKKLENSLFKWFIFIHPSRQRINLIDTFPVFYQCKYFENINSQSGDKVFYPIWESRNELLLVPQSNGRNLLLSRKLRHIVRRITHQNTFYVIWMWKYNK